MFGKATSLTQSGTAIVCLTHGLCTSIQTKNLYPPKCTQILNVVVGFAVLFCSHFLLFVSLLNSIIRLNIVTIVFCQ